MPLSVLYVLSAVCAYLFVGLNPAIIISKAVYKRDIRELGSGNPGFTNFKRVFGNRLAYVVLVFDLAKSAAAVAVFAELFRRAGAGYQLGAAYTGLFCMLGHAFPVWYRFKGGKGFLVLMSVIWFIDWRAGLIALGVLALLLFTAKIMSLSTMAAMVASFVFIAVAGTDTPAVLWLYGAEVLLLIVRHAENIKRLFHGTEKKFSFKSNPEK